MKKCKRFLFENFQFLEVKFSIYEYLNRRVFVTGIYSRGKELASVWNNSFFLE